MLLSALTLPSMDTLNSTYLNETHHHDTKFIGERVNFNGTLFAKSKVNSSHSLHTNMRVQQTFQVAQIVRNLPAVQETQFDPWVRKIPWRRAWQTTPVFLPGESPWTEEPGRLQSIGLQRAGRD